MVPVTASRPLIRTRGLTRRFGGLTAVDQLDLTVYAGEIYGFLGPNGSGKTTTIKMLTGLLEPTAGEVVIAGFNVKTQPTRAKAVMAYVPDQPTLYPKLTAREFLLLMADLYRVPREEARDRCQQLLALFGLADRAEELLEGFSHGMKQKTVVAAALIHRPQVMILDEPTVGLDPHSARLLKDILQELARQGVAVFLSTHILEIAERMCHRVGILQRGHLIAQGSLAELRARGRGEGETLEDIFLELTGSAEEAEVIKGLEEERA